MYARDGNPVMSLMAEEGIRAPAKALPAIRRSSGSLFDLARDNGAPVALRDIGMNEADIDRAADLVVNNPYWNPRDPIGLHRTRPFQRLCKSC